MENQKVRPATTHPCPTSTQWWWPGIEHELFKLMTLFTRTEAIAALTILSYIRPGDLCLDANLHQLAYAADASHETVAYVLHRLIKSGLLVRSHWDYKISPKATQRAFLRAMSASTKAQVNEAL